MAVGTTGAAAAERIYGTWTLRLHDHLVGLIAMLRRRGSAHFEKPGFDRDPAEQAQSRLRERADSVASEDGDYAPTSCARPGYDPVADRVRLDPLDAKTSRHAGECEFVSEADPAVLKILLKVKPGLGEGYDWVECGACGAGWQVAHHAESVG